MLVLNIRAIFVNFSEQYGFSDCIEIAYMLLYRAIFFMMAAMPPVIMGSSKQDEGLVEV